MPRFTKIEVFVRKRAHLPLDGIKVFCSHPTLDALLSIKMVLFNISWIDEECNKDKARLRGDGPMPRKRDRRVECRYYTLTESSVMVFMASSMDIPSAIAFLRAALTA